MMTIPISVQVSIDDEIKEVSFTPIWNVEKTNEVMTILSNSLMESIITFDIARFPFDELLRLDLYRYKRIITIKDMYDILSIHIIDTILTAGWDNKSSISRHIYDLWCTVYKELITHGITSIAEIDRIKSKFKLEFIYTYFCNSRCEIENILDTMLINKINWILYHTYEFDDNFRKLLRNVATTISKQKHTVYAHNPTKLVYCQKKFKDMISACIEPLYVYDTVILGHSTNKDATEWVMDDQVSKYCYCNDSTYELYVDKYTKIQDIINEQDNNSHILICVCNYCKEPAISLPPADLNLSIEYSHIPNSIVLSEFRTSE